MKTNTIGTCSLCGGPVITAEGCVSYPFCSKCGATPQKVQHGPVIPMQQTEVSKLMWKEGKGRE